MEDGDPEDDRVAAHRSSRDTNAGRAMPCQHAIDPQRCFVLVRANGRVTGADVNAVYRAVLTDPAWQPTFQILWDATEIRSLEVAWEEAEAFRNAAATLSDRVGEGRSAVVARRDLDAMMANNYIIFGGRHPRRDPGREVQVFSSISVAIEWLGVSAADVETLRSQLEGA